MNADRLLKLYDKVAEAPDAIERLRRFVLDLAVRGKLVEQDPSDEPASELLKRIAAEREHMVKAGVIKKQKTVPPLQKEGLPFELPQRWAWTQIAELGAISPRNDVDDDLEASFVSMPMISEKYGVASEHEPRSWREIKKGYTHFAEGDVGLAKITPCFENGKSTVFRNLTGGIGAGTTELHIVRPILVNPDFILLFFKSAHFIETGISKMTGTAGQKRVPKDYFTSSPFPLPPLGEQRRILAKVEELMALLDRLEAARSARETTRDRLTTASLARLTAPDTDPEVFPDHARFALDTLSALTTRPEQIKSLRQTILNLAIRGKLVEQNPTDEPASELLKRITEEKARLVKANLIRKPKALGPMSVCKDANKIPRNWEAQHLGSLSTIITKGSTPTSYGHAFTDSGVNFLKVESIVHGRVDSSSISSFISQETHEFLGRSQLEAGDVLFSIAGSIGTCALVTPEVTPANTNQALAIIRGTSLAYEPNFLILLLRSFVSNAVKDKARGGAMNNVSLTDLKNLTVPVPPLAEQKRIVAKVEELMALLDRLEVVLRQADITCANLLEALLYDSLEAPSRESEAA